MGEFDLFRSENGKMKEENEHWSKVWSERFGEPVHAMRLPLKSEPLHKAAPREPPSREEHHLASTEHTMPRAYNAAQMDRKPSSEVTLRGRINAIAMLKRDGKIDDPTFSGINKVLADACFK